MLTAGAGTEVLAGYQDLSPIGGVVQDERGDLVALLVVTPVTEEVLTESLLGRCLQEASRDDLISVHILQGKGYTGTCYDVEFLFHRKTHD